MKQITPVNNGNSAHCSTLTYSQRHVFTRHNTHALRHERFHRWFLYSWRKCSASLVSMSAVNHSIVLYPVPQAQLFLLPRRLPHAGNKVNTTTVSVIQLLLFPQCVPHRTQNRNAHSGNKASNKSVNTISQPNSFIY